jgi:enterochelin esterase family protein
MLVAAPPAPLVAPFSVVLRISVFALAVTAAPLDGVLAPTPAERTVGPTYTVDPSTQPQGKPRGRRFTFTMALLGSRSIFNGSDPCLDPKDPPARQRRIYVNIPAAYQDGTPAPLLIMQDGPGHIDLVDNCQSNLAEQVEEGAGESRRLPTFVTVAIANGGGSERSLEYNTMSGRYTEFVEREVLPAVLSRPDIRAAYPHLRFTSDPFGRAAIGCSAGGIAAITMGFFRPDFLTRIAAYSPAAVDLQVPGQPEKLSHPMGAREYWDGQRLIETTPKRPLRVFVNDNEFDLGWCALLLHPLPFFVDGSVGFSAPSERSLLGLVTGGETAVWVARRGGNCPPWVDKEKGNTTAEYFLGCWSTWDCSPPGSCADGEHNRRPAQLTPLN